MASAAEQLAANLNFAAFAKAEELKKRIWFTLGALIVYRLGTYIPLPGIDPEHLRQIFQQQAGGILGLFNMFSGGAVERMAIFALGIMPYISASIIIQLLTSVVPSLEALEEGRRGRPQGHQPVHPLPHGRSARCSRPTASPSASRAPAGVVSDPGSFFRISTRHHADRRHHVPDVARRADHRARHRQRHLADHLRRHRRPAARGHRQHARTRPQGALSTALILGVIVLAVAVIDFIVFMERAQRRLLIQYPKRQVGNRMYEGQTSFLPLKLNTSGVIPPIFASSLLLLPTTIASFSANQGDTGLAGDASPRYLGHGRPLYMLLYAAADHLLRLLLHGDRVQSGGDRRQPEEARRLHPGHPPGRAHRRIHRQRPDPHHGDRRGLPDHRLPDARNC